jgi:hypothetical protein
MKYLRNMGKRCPTGCHKKKKSKSKFGGFRTISADAYKKKRDKKPSAAARARAYGKRFRKMRKRTGV